MVLLAKPERERLSRLVKLADLAFDPVDMREPRGAVLKEAKAARARLTRKEVFLYGGGTRTRLTSGEQSAYVFGSRS